MDALLFPPKKKKVYYQAARVPTLLGGQYTCNFLAISLGLAVFLPTASRFKMCYLLWFEIIISISILKSIFVCTSYWIPPPLNRVCHLRFFDEHRSLRGEGSERGGHKNKKRIKKKEIVVTWHISPATRRSQTRWARDKMGPPRESHVFNKRKSGGEGEGEAQWYTIGELTQASRCLSHGKFNAYQIPAARWHCCRYPWSGSPGKSSRSSRLYPTPRPPTLDVTIYILYACACACACVPRPTNTARPGRRSRERRFVRTSVVLKESFSRIQNKKN